MLVRSFAPNFVRAFVVERWLLAVAVVSVVFEIQFGSQAAVSVVGRSGVCFLFARSAVPSSTRSVCCCCLLFSLSDT